MASVKTSTHRRLSCCKVFSRSVLVKVLPLPSNYSSKLAIFYHHKLRRVEGEVRDRFTSGDGADRATSSSAVPKFYGSGL